MSIILAQSVKFWLAPSALAPTTCILIIDSIVLQNRKKFSLAPALATLTVFFFQGKRTGDPEKFPTALHGGHTRKYAAPLMPL